LIQTPEFDQTILQESEEFQTFMNYHTGWYIQNISARIENKHTFNSEKIQLLKADWETNGIPDLSSKKMQEISSSFNFKNSIDFANYFNNYGKAKSALAIKFPQLSDSKNASIFLDAQHYFIENLKFENLISTKKIGLRNDTPEPGEVALTFEMPRCHWSQTYEDSPEVFCFGFIPDLVVTNTNAGNPDFSNCPDFIQNNCQHVYDGCVNARQIDFLQAMARCFGDEFIYHDVADILDGDCFFALSEEGGESEYICENPAGTGGFDTVLFILDGFSDISPGGANGQSAEECYDCIARDYFSFVCVSCINLTRSSCCF